MEMELLLIVLYKLLNSLTAKKQITSLTFLKGNTSAVHKFLTSAGKNHLSPIILKICT